MSEILEEIDRALVAFNAQQGQPVAIELGGQKYTQLAQDVAQQHSAGGPLTADTGRPLAYKGLEILRDDEHADLVRVI